MGCNCGKAIGQAKKLTGGRQIGRAVVIGPAATKAAGKGKRIPAKKVAARKIPAAKIAPCTGCGKK